MRLLAPIIAALALAGCGLVHTIDVQQGNYVTQDVAAKLRTGMTKAEVRQLLGTPLLIDAFHANRWDYFFSNVKRGKAENRTRLTVFFENDKVASFTGEARPSLPPPVGAPAAPAPPVAAPAAAAKK
jgi:outer membrane protein assembly factor BamE